MLQRAHLILVRYILISAGALAATLAVIIFLKPLDIAPMGVTGVSTLVNELLGTPIGLMIFLLNIPIQLLGYKLLPDSTRVILRTVLIIVLLSVMIDQLGPLVPAEGIIDNRMLGALFGGILNGVGIGLVYRAGATMGGTTTLALLLQRRFGFPMSTTFLLTDVLIISAAGFVFGWEGALYSAIALFVTGLASDYVLEGPSVIRTAMIITDKPDEIAALVFAELKRGATSWTIKGQYSGAERTMLYVTVSRSQVRELKDAVNSIDPNAFMVIGMGHAAYGTGFRRARANLG